MKTADLIEALRGRYRAPEWELFFEVGNGTGWNANRHLDVVAVSTWPSRGLRIIGFELKVSRSDWRKEVDNPEKAEPFAGLVDQFVVVTPKGIVQPGEMPATWAHLEVSQTKTGFRTKMSGPEPREPRKEDPRHLLVALVRAATREAHNMVSREIASRADKAAQAARDLVDRRVESLQGELERHREMVREFEEKAGVRITRWDHGRVGEAVRMLLDAQSQHRQSQHRQLTRSAQVARQVSEQLSKAAEELQALDKDPAP